MCNLFKREKPKPQVELLSMPSEIVETEVSELKVTMLYPALVDTKYFYTKAEDWAEVFDWIFFKFDMPKYLTDRMDCDDFAVLLKGLVASFFGLNYFGVVFGEMPMGYHAWNVFRTDSGVWQFEPQTGAYFPLGEKGYKPEWLLL